MLNERKIRLMMKLAEYETGKGKEDLKIAGYYRSDYLGRALLKNFLLVTIGYGLILILIGAYYADFLLDTIHQMDLLMLGTAVLGGYIIVLTVYSVVTYAVCALRYSKAERSAEWYERRLAQLEKFYGGENAGSQKKKAGGVMYDLAIGSKRKIKEIYAKYGILFQIIGKFILAMTVFKGINVRLNAVEKLDNIFVLLILSLLCSILPLNMTVVFGAVLLIGQCYGIGIETAGFAALLLLLLMILFIRFNTKDTLALLLTPIAFVLKIPAVIPMGYGLVRTPASAVSTGCGVVVYYFMELVREKMPLLQSADKKEVKDILQNLKVLLDGVVKNQDMLMYIIAFTAVILLVYILRRLSVEYAWYIAILSGSVAYVVVMIAGGLFLDVKIRMLPLILGTLAAAVIGVIMEFFLFHVDYAMMKRLQFEDDEYYYYVKAVPKISVAEQKAAARAIRKKVPHDVSNEHSEEISGEIPEEDSENTDIPVEAPMEDVDFESKLEESLKNL